MNISEFNFQTFDRNNDFQMKPTIVCNDGFTMSVQGSRFHYCEPRETSNYYFSMEIGFPSDVETLLLHKAENSSDPTQTVYGWVECDIIDEVITKHGGINEELTFKTKD
jgi:hypothetical protein